MKSKKVYANNIVNDELVEEVKEVVSQQGVAEVYFDVTGRTKNQMLGYQLWNKLGKDSYDAIIDYDTYDIIFSRKQA